MSSPAAAAVPTLWAVRPFAPSRRTNTRSTPIPSPAAPEAALVLDLERLHRDVGEPAARAEADLRLDGQTGGQTHRVEGLLQPSPGEVRARLLHGFDHELHPHVAALRERVVGVG